MTESIVEPPDEVPLQRRTLPDGTLVLELPPRGAGRIFSDESASFLLIIGLGATAIWMGWYAHSAIVVLAGVGFFAAVLLVAVVRLLGLARDDGDGTRVEVDAHALRLRDLGQEYVWDARDVCHVAASYGEQQRPRLLVRTREGLHEVIRFRNFRELRALAEEIRAVLAPQMAENASEDGRLAQAGRGPHDAPQPLPSRAVVSHGAGGDTLVVLRPHPTWRRVAPYVAGVVVTAGFLALAVATPRSWDSATEQVYGCLLLLAILLLLIGLAVREFLRRVETTARVTAQQLIITTGRHRRSWPWWEIADVDAGKMPNDDSSTMCLLVRCFDRIDAALDGEDRRELEWLARILRGARPPASNDRPHPERDVVQ